MMQAPLKPGYHDVRPTVADDVLLRRESTLGYTKNLADLSRDYVFLNHGGLFAYAGFVDDPVADFVNSFVRNVDIALVDTEVEFVLNTNGRPTPFPWTRTLLAVPTPDWPAVHLHLRSCGFIDRNAKTFGQVRLTTIRFSDPVAIRNKHAHIGEIEAYFAGVDGNIVNFAFRAKPYPDHSRFGLLGVEVIATQPSEYASVLGDAMLRGDSQPFAAVEV